MVAVDVDRMTAERQAVSVAELAAMLGVSDEAVYNAIDRDGEVIGVKPLRVGRRIVFSRRLVERVLEGQP